MADNKNIQDGRDRSKVNGNNRDDVEAWLKKHKNA